MYKNAFEQILINAIISEFKMYYFGIKYQFSFSFKNLISTFKFLNCNM